MGFGPVVILAKDVGGDAMEVVFRFVTSLVDEAARNFLLMGVFDEVAREIELLEIGDPEVFREEVPWGRETFVELPTYERTAHVEYLRQAEPTGPIHMTLTQDFEWHELRDEPTPHKNIVYEARVTWAN